MCQHGLSRNCQPQSRSPGLVREVWLPHAGKIGRGDARTVVAHGDLDCITASVANGFRLDRYSSRFAAGIDGIEDHVR